MPFLKELHNYNPAAWNDYSLGEMPVIQARGVVFCASGNISFAART